MDIGIGNIPCKPQFDLRNNFSKKENNFTSGKFNI